MTADLFAADRNRIVLDPGAWLLGGFALDRAAALLDAIAAISAAAPFRHLETPGGRRMSVAMTNCGTAGWVSDRSHGPLCRPCSARWRMRPPAPRISRALRPTPA
jgi:alkylated DNA repair protein (DNA oxidative demethylase)